MNIKDRFSNSFLRAEDISSPLTLTITDVTEETIGDDDRVVLTFRADETDKRLPLNKTNALALAELFGDDTDGWTDQSVELYKDHVQFNGKRTAAIRLRAPRQVQPKPTQRGRGGKEDKLPF